MSIDNKREKFKRLANTRVNVVLDKLRLIGNLSDKRQDIEFAVNTFAIS